MLGTLTLLLAGMAAAPPTADAGWKEHLADTVKEFRAGKYSAAEQAAQQAKNEAESDPQRAEALTELARAECKRGRYAGALVHMDEADALFAKQAGRHPALEAKAGVVRALLLWEVGRGEEATPLAEKAHHALLKHLGPGHMDTVDAFEAWALVADKDGGAAVAMREKLSGKGQPAAAPAHLLAARWRMSDEATEDRIRRAIRLFQKMDDRHADLPEAWTLLGQHLARRGQLAEAGQTLELALEKWRGLDGRHPRMAPALAHLAAVRGRQGRGAEADKLFLQALEHHFADFSDESLLRQFARILTGDGRRWATPGEEAVLNDYEAYLTELTRRGGLEIERALAARAKALTKAALSKDDGGMTARNLETLTVLRRTQRKDDPVAVVVKGPAEVEAIFPHVPDIGVALVNNLDEKTDLGFRKGGDYRSGRLERWRLAVRDAKGNHVPVRGDATDSIAREGGGLYGHGVLKPGQKWHASLPVNSYIRDLPPGEYTLRVQYHDRDEIAGLDWLAGRVVCQSPEVKLHLQPRVIDATAAERKAVARLIAQLDAKGEVKIFGGRYGKPAHDFIPPDTPPGRLLALGWKAVPQMIDAVLDESTHPHRRAWLLGLLHSATTRHSPTGVEGVLPDHTAVSPGWAIWFGGDEERSSGGMGWSGPSRVAGAKIDLAKQLQFAKRWADFRKHLVVRKGE